MKAKFQVSSFKLQVARLNPEAGTACRLEPKTCNSSHLAFSLVELLVVISILGILAGIAVPALKDMGKANVQISAARQLLDDVGRARQLAISQHTTVYMVFVPTNYFTLNNIGGQNFWTGLNAITDPRKRNVALTVATNLVEKQLTGYTFLSLGQLGDQPGQHSWQYLTSWQSLPQGSYISPFKYLPSGNSPLQIYQWQQDHPNADGNRIYPFQGYSFPFPTVDSPLVYLPCLAFNYLGQLVTPLSNGSSLITSDAYIPLVQGIVGYGLAPSTKLPIPTPVSYLDIAERPPGNGTNISYNIVHISNLTGRATLEYFKMP